MFDGNFLLKNIFSKKAETVASQKVNDTFWRRGPYMFGFHKLCFYVFFVLHVYVYIFL